MYASDLRLVRSCKHCSIGARTNRRACGKSARPTVSNPATLTPVRYLQFEAGILGATDSAEFSTRYEINEVVKLAVSRRLEYLHLRMRCNWVKFAF